MRKERSSLRTTVIVRNPGFPKCLSTYMVETHENVVKISGSRLDQTWADKVVNSPMLTLKNTGNGFKAKFGSKSIALDYTQIHQLAVAYWVQCCRDTHNGIEMTEIDFDDRPEVK